MGIRVGIRIGIVLASTATTATPPLVRQLALAPSIPRIRSPDDVQALVLPSSRTRGNLRRLHRAASSSRFLSHGRQRIALHPRASGRCTSGSRCSSSSSSWNRDRSCALAFWTTIRRNGRRPRGVTLGGPAPAACLLARVTEQEPLQLQHGCARAARGEEDKKGVTGGWTGGRTCHLMLVLRGLGAAFGDTASHCRGCVYHVSGVTRPGEGSLYSWCLPSMNHGWSCLMVHRFWR